MKCCSARDAAAWGGQAGGWKQARDEGRYGDGGTDNQHNNQRGSDSSRTRQNECIQQSDGEQQRDSWAREQLSRIWTGGGQGVHGAATACSRGRPLGKRLPPARPQENAAAGKMARGTCIGGACGHAGEGRAANPDRKPRARRGQHGAVPLHPSLEHGRRLETRRRGHAWLQLLEARGCSGAQRGIVELDVVVGGLVPGPVLRAGMAGRSPGYQHNDMWSASRAARQAHPLFQVSQPPPSPRGDSVVPQEGMQRCRASLASSKALLRSPFR